MDLMKTKMKRSRNNDDKILKISNTKNTKSGTIQVSWHLIGERGDKRNKKMPYRKNQLHQDKEQKYNTRIKIRFLYRLFVVQYVFKSI